jgi:hypothetical protein
MSTRLDPLAASAWLTLRVLSAIKAVDVGYPTTPSCEREYRKLP